MNKRQPEYIALYLFVFGAILLFGVLARKFVLVKGYDEFSAAVGFFATAVVLSALYISLQMTLNECGSVDALFAKCFADVPAEVHQVNAFEY